MEFVQGHRTGRLDITFCGPQVSSDVVNEEPVKITHTNLVRESFLQDPYDRQRPRRNGLSERRKGSVMSRFPLTKV